MSMQKKTLERPLTAAEAGALGGAAGTGSVKARSTDFYKRIVLKSHAARARNKALRVKQNKKTQAQNANNDDSKR